MRRIFLASPARLAAVVVLALGLTLAARGEDASLRKQIVALGQTTGDKTINAEIKALIAQPDKTRKLLAEAAEMLKSKDPLLSYNGAYILGQAASELKHLNSAEALYRVCTAQAAKLQSTKKILQSYGALIDMFYENKKFAQSVKVCRELLELKTGDGKQRDYLRGITNRLGQPDFLPDDDFDAAKALRPGVHRLMIQAIAKQGNYAKALKLVDSLIKAQDTWQERQLRAWVLRESGKPAEAARAYEDVLERIQKDTTLDQEEKDSYTERYRYILSNVFVDLKQINKAETQLRALIAKRPDEPSYYNDLGYILADHDMQIAEAEKLIRKALELDKAKRRRLKVPAELDHDNGAYLDSLGWVLFKQKKYKEAKEALEAAVKDKNSQHIEIYDHLGDTLMALGERSAAVAAWRRGIEVAGQSSRERRIRAAVERKLERYASNK